MSNIWLWDKNLSVNEAKKILKNPDDKRFIKLSATLLSRTNSSKDVFKQYLKPIDFCRNWQKIKRVMRQDDWNNPRIEFWQAIYEKLLEKYKSKKIQINNKKESVVVDELCKNIGEKIKNIRIQNGLTQKQIAKKLNVSQQLISRIENGQENISILTLKNIAKVLNLKVFLDIK